MTDSLTTSPDGLVGVLFLTPIAIGEEEKLSENELRRFPLLNQVDSCFGEINGKGNSKTG
jgi:hypothetical protein